MQTPCALIAWIIVLICNYFSQKFQSKALRFSTSWENMQLYNLHCGFCKPNATYKNDPAPVITYHYLTLRGFIHRVNSMSICKRSTRRHTIKSITISGECLIPPECFSRYDCNLDLVGPLMNIWIDIKTPADRNKRSRWLAANSVEYM